MLKVKSNFLRTCLVCVSVAFAALFGYVMLQNLFAELFIRLNWEARGTDSHLFENGYWSAFLIMAIMFPVLEELVFRFCLCNFLKKIKLPNWYVIIISAIIFMVYHFSWSQIVYQLLMGIWLGWIFIKTSHIGWTVLIHFINNAFVITYIYLTGSENAVFDLNAGNIILSISLAVITTVVIAFLIKKGIPEYEKQ